jgi:hypothetical protein
MASPAPTFTKSAFRATARAMLLAEHPNMPPHRLDPTAESLAQLLAEDAQRKAYRAAKFLPQPALDPAPAAVALPLPGGEEKPGTLIRKAA